MLITYNSNLIIKWICNKQIEHSTHNRHYQIKLITININSHTMIKEKEL
jgi:hypothetical protein